MAAGIDLRGRDAFKEPQPPQTRFVEYVKEIKTNLSNGGFLLKLLFCTEFRRRHNKIKRKW